MLSRLAMLCALASHGEPSTASIVMLRSYIQHGSENIPLLPPFIAHYHSFITHFITPLELIITTLRGDGCVLLPVDAAGRVLELLLLLEGFWAQEK